MKKNYYIWCLCLLCFGCGNEPAKTEALIEEQTIEDTLITSESVTDLSAFQDVELSGSDNDIMNELKGDYYELDADGESFKYKEPSEFGTFGFQIVRKLDDVNFWEIVWMNRAIDIFKVEKTDGEIVIYGYDDEEVIFYINESAKSKVVTVNLSGYRDDFYFTKAKNIYLFKAEACVNKDAFLRNIPTRWFGLTKKDGQDVLFEPCEEIPMGLSFDTQTIDFWSGSDPYSIIEISKLFDDLTIIYQTNLSKDTLVLKYQSSNVFKIGNGSADDPLYVSEIAKDYYKTVKEDCE